MHAFSEAVGLGFGWIETDLHLTADGVLVCLHDDTLDRTTDGSGPVWEHTFTEVSALDAGYRHRVADDRPFRGQGIRVPAFEELVGAHPDVRFVVDLKQDGLEAPLAALIERADLWDRLIVGSFSDDRLAEFRRLTGDRVATSAGPRDVLRAWGASWFTSPPRVADALQIPRSYRLLPIVTGHTVSAFHDAGMDVHVWTVNDPVTMATLLDWGVDGIISDRPDVLRGVLENRGMWHP